MENCSGWGGLSTEMGVGAHHSLSPNTVKAADGQVTYADGTSSSIDQMSKDVSAFLVWTAEPKLEARHSTGIAVLGFLLIATILAYLSYRNIWAGVKH